MNRKRLFHARWTMFATAVLSGLRAELPACSAAAPYEARKTVLLDAPKIADEHTFVGCGEESASWYAPAEQSNNLAS